MLEHEQHTERNARDGDYMLHCRVECVYHRARMGCRSARLRSERSSQVEFQFLRGSSRTTGVGMGGNRNNISANRQFHQAPKAAKHAATDDEMSSPFFFFWRNKTTSGTTSFGVPSPITLGRIFFDTLAFALPTLEPFLDL
jgi:hypothetical protein